MSQQDEVTVAAVGYPVERLKDFSAWHAKQRTWLERAHTIGADFVVFPEYGLMELSGLYCDTIAGDLHRSIDVIQSLMPDVRTTGVSLAKEFGVHLLMSSGPVRLDDGRTVNRAYLCTPSGAVDFQDKIVMTRFEREWGICGNGPLKLFETAIGNLGVLICYDSEFPLLGRALAEADVEFLAVPSCTEMLSGFHRVRIGASSRALESQCVAIQAPLLGEASWSQAIDLNQGRAAIYGPPDEGFPESGEFSAANFNKGDIATAKVSRAAIARVRSDGNVLNRAHWIDQAIAGSSQTLTDLVAVERVRLT